MSWIKELAVIPALAVAFTGGLLILLDNRRMILVTLALQYLFVSWLVGVTLPIQVAAAKLVAGLMACSIMALTLMKVGWPAQSLFPHSIPSGRVFRAIALLLALLVAGGLGQSNWISLPGLSTAGVYGSTILLAIGLLHIGLNEEPVRVGAGLLTIMAGFEVIYSAIEPSLAVMALLAAVHLGIAFVVSYLLANGTDKAVEPQAIE